MAGRKLARPVTAWRIGDPEGRFPIYSEEGARRNEGRWHSKGQAVIYASEHYGTAMLEKLAHYNGLLPPNQWFIEILIPAGATCEVVTRNGLQGWDRQDASAARSFGSRWISEIRSTILYVPSVVSREENNILINPADRHAGRITVSAEKPVRWDARLFGSAHRAH